MFRNLKVKEIIFSNVIKLATGTMLSQIINILFSPLLSRLFTPEEFGVSVLFQSMGNIVLAICTLKLDSAIIVAKDEEKVEKLTLTSLIFTFLISLTFFVSMLIINGFNIEIFSIGNNIILITFLFFSISLSGVNTTYTNVANRKMDYKVLMWVPLINTLSGTGFNIILGIMGIKQYGLILGILLGQIIIAVYLLKIYRVPKVSPDIIKTLKEYRDFPLYQMPSIFINTISVQFPIFAFSYYFSDIITGWYSMSQRVLLLPLTIIGSAISQVYFRKIAILYNENESMHLLTKKLLITSFTLAFFPMLIILSSGDKIFGLVFGQSWIEAGNIARYLVPWFLMVFVASPLSNVLIVLKKQKQNLIMNTIMLFSRILAIGFGAAFLSDYKETIMLFGFVGFILWYLFSIYIIKLTGIKTSKYIIFSMAFFILLFILSFFIRNFFLVEVN